MDLTIHTLLAAFLVSLTSLTLLVARDWRLSIGLLSAQYIGVALLVAVQWPLQMAVTKLIAGWMAGAVLGMAIASVPELRAELSGGWTQPGRSPGKSAPRMDIGIPFYLLAALLVALAMLSQIGQVVTWIPEIGLSVAWGGLFLIGMGLLKLGFTIQPLHIILGLLTALAGFEILYSAIETSVLIAGLLAGVNLGLAMVGAYMLLTPHMEDTE